MTKIDKTKPVMVTGATGYVAGWLVKKLLDEGITVHAAVRDPENEEKLEYLNNLAAEAPGKIKYFKADLLDEGSYDEAMQGCELVYHTASPFSLNVDDVQKDLIEPALKGTRNVLESVNRTESVKRVVLTSSCAAIYGDVADIAENPGGKITEEDWNTTSSESHQPYSYSKTAAEKEAWNIAEDQDIWDLVVINPSLVLGPGINPNGTSESFNVVKQLGDGTMKAGAPHLAMGMVDVRDVADAHYKAGFTPDTKGRHIISAEVRTLLELSEMLQKKYGDKYPFPKRKMPKWLIWIFGPVAGFSRKMVSRNIGYDGKIDNTKSKKELNMSYRPVEESITGFFEQMINNGIVKPKA